MTDRPGHKGPVKVTITDPETGEVLEEQVLDNNWTIICAGNRYVKSIQQMGSTVMLAIAKTKPSALAGAGEREGSK